MGPETYERERAENRRVYETLREQLRREHPGKHAAIARGKLLDIVDTFEDAAAAVESLEPAPQHFLVFAVEEEEVLDPYFSY